MSESSFECPGPKPVTPNSEFPGIEDENDQNNQQKRKRDCDVFHYQCVHSCCMFPKAKRECIQAKKVKVEHAINQFVGICGNFYWLK